MIKIIRFKENNVGTWGELTWDGFKCYTFEPEGPDCIESGKDRRIPEGIYNIRWHNSPRYGKKMPNLFNDRVPASRCILIHNGNFPDDTCGCILPGKTLSDKGVLNSKPVFNELRDRMVKTFGLETEFIPEKLEIINNF